MKIYHVMIFSLILVIAPATVLGQTSGLITLLSDDNSIFLNSQEQQALAELRANPLIASIRFVAINVGELEQTSTTIQLPGGESVNFNKTELENTSYGTTEWTGVQPEEMGMVIITVSGKNVSGVIDFANRLYQVSDLGTGNNHVLMERLMSTGGYEWQCSMSSLAGDLIGDVLQEDSTTFLVPSIEKRNVAGNNLRVLIAYTSKAEAIALKKGTTIKALSVDAVKYTNQAYRNSKIYNKIDIARLVKVNYTETDINDPTADFLGDSRWFYYDSDIARLRETHSADIAVLLTGAEPASEAVQFREGFAVDAHKGPSADYGICNVKLVDWPDYPTIESFMTTFAHETGHLQGADHDLQNVGDRYNWPCEPYAHGYYNLAEGWRTIMSYPVNPDYRSAIIPYFSNPDVKHPDTGSPLGTTNCNNAKALNENDELIKDYRVPKNELTVSDLSLPANEIADFNAISSIHVSNLVTEAGSHTGFKAGSSVVIEKNTIINGKLKTSIVQVAGCASGKILSTTPKQLSLPSCPAIPICVELNCADSYTAQLMNMTNPSRPNWFEVSYASGTITDGKICIPMDQNVKAGNKYALFVEAKNLFIEQVLTFGITIDQGSCPSLTCPTGNCPLMEGAGRQATRVKPEGQQIAISDEVFHSTIHPNPVCNSAVIEYYLPGAAFVSITVFNGMGKQVKFNGHQLLQKGQHQTNFDTSHLTPGFYTYTIHAGGKYETGRFVIVK